MSSPNPIAATLHSPRSLAPFVVVAITLICWAASQLTTQVA
jgi:hypothetical protein